MQDAPYRSSPSHGFCECGCGQRTSLARQTSPERGWTRGEPLRFVRGHNNAGREIKAERWVVEDCGYETPCWVWALKVGHNGYGYVIRKRTGQLLAHRVVYEQHIGPIPADHILHHRCENPRCVNPAHLEPVTRAEHAQRHVEIRTR